MKTKLTILLLIIFSTVIFAKEKTVLLYELNDSKIATYGEKILSPYTYEIKQMDTEIKNFIEIFNFLSLKKDQIYKGYSLLDTPETQKKLLEKKIVTIELSNHDKNNFKEVSSEIIYSLTENGAKGVIFLNNPIKKDKVFKRVDVEFTSFVLFIPYSHVLPPNTVTSGFIKIPNSSPIKASKFYKKIKKGDKNINKLIVELVKNGEKNLKINAIKALPHTKVKNIEKLLVPNLDEKDNEIVLASLDGLLGSKNKKVLNKLSELLENNKNDLIKLNSAKTLIASGNKKFIISGLKYFLESNDIKAKKEAIKSISKHKNSEEILLLMLDDKSTRIKLTVLEYLKTAKRNESFDKLLTLLNDKSLKVKLTASNILLTNKKYKKFGLYYQLKSLDLNLSVKAASELKNYKSKETNDNLLTCIEKCRANETAFEASKTLLSFKEKSAITPFFKRLELSKLETKELNKMIESFLKLLSQKELIKILQEKKVKLLSKEIIKVLGISNKQNKNDKVINEIKAFLTSDNEEIRIESVKSLTLISGDKALESVLSISDDKSEKVRASILEMSKDYTKDQVKDLLLKYLNDTSDKIRITAMNLIMKFKVEEAIPQLRQYIGSSIKDVKLKSLETLITISNKISSDLEEKFQTLLDQDDDSLRVWAIYGLAKTGKKTNLPFITPYGSSDFIGVRKAVMYAVGELDHENNSKIDVAYGGLDDDILEVKIEAAKAIKKVGQKSDIEKIEKLLPTVKNKEVKTILNQAISTIKNRTSED